ncbi:MAG: type I DNA topoisomerase [Bacteroidales bacterium]|nr:type I DNA topoisomerase [Bacteroidales bacterium]
MAENLVIVESPTKARKIQGFLGKEYVVKSSEGHIRDLSKKDLGIDTDNGFNPDYIIPADKKKLVKELKSAASAAKTIWLASDEDREGEAIAWHLQQVLELNRENTKRIAFHEITPAAIHEAIKNPRDIDDNLVMAQQARRVLDRLVGFELSPILWKKVKPNLSAGRVQSVAVRLIVDREREINAFNSQDYYKVEGIFSPEGSGSTLKAVLDKRFNTAKEAEDFLEKCKSASFSISNIEKKAASRTPAAPFTTSVLQQEAARKLGFSVTQTMQLAQRLYEAGLITYMRTDSVNLSSLAINTAKAYVNENFGAEYSKVRQYRTKSKGAQEAHEAIRPTYIQNVTIEGTSTEKKLYSLIWKRTIASQMADAKLERTVVTISGTGLSETFSLEAEQILFDGFLKVYLESSDDEEAENDTLAIIPNVSNGQNLNCKEISALQKFTVKPARYSEASLVKKLEELGIGRPSTYAPTVNTILKRGYVVKGDRKGEEKKLSVITLKDGQIKKTEKKETLGTEKGKLFPENIGIVVNDYLASNFQEILDYGFTAKVEEDFDKIAAGKLIWNNMIGKFYAPFHKKVEQTLEEKEYTHAERLIGVDPVSGKPLTARIGRFGPLVQKGAADDPEKQFASMKKGQLIESITLEEALRLFDLPRTVGKYNDQVITAAIGRFGPYIKVGSKFISLGKSLDPYTITEEQAVSLIQEDAQREEHKLIADFPESKIQVLNGRYGAYIKQGKKNYKIPRSKKAEQLTEKDCLEIIASSK